MKKIISLVFLFANLILPSQVQAEEIKSSVINSSVSKSRQTPYNLYLTPEDAHAALAKNPSIILIDVRDPVEISFVGHPMPMDANIPLRTVSRDYNQQSGSYKMIQNTNFVSEVGALMKRLGFSKLHPIIMSCRSGPRSAVAARLLHVAGYENVWNQVEGFEGSIDKKTGARSKNGWRNAGLPWSYKIRMGTEWRPLQN